jgi:hypothetical protein
MNLEIGRFTHSAPVTPVSPHTRGEHSGTTDATRAPVGTAGFDTILGDIPPAPPEEARKQVDVAAQRVDELAASNRELHFTQDKDSGRVIIQVRDLEGKVIRTIPPSHALDVLSGAAL